MANLESLFANWLEGKVLTDKQLALLESDVEYAHMMDEARYWQQQSCAYENVTVPEWDPSSTMTHINSPSFSWQLPAIWAMAASVVIFVLVFSFSPQSSDQQLLEQVARQTRLLESQQKQIDQLERILTAQNDLQQQKMYQLAKEAIAAGRIERQEDIATVLAYIKTQRAQDQAYLRMQLNDLAEQVDGQTMPAVANNLEY